MAVNTSFVRSAVRSIQSALPVQKGGVYILAYHLVGGGTDFRVDLPADVFRHHLEYIKAKTKPLSLSEALVQLSDGKKTDSTTVVVTFDDAYSNFYTHAWPLLAEFEIPCTLYIPVDFVEGKTSGPLQGSNSLPACSWQQLREMTAGGLVAPASHTYSHPNLQRVTSAVAQHEVVDSREELEQKLGTKVTSFAYPKAFWSSLADEFVRATYDNAVIAGGRKLQPGKWQRYRLSRMPLQRHMEDLAPILDSPVWLEERIASVIRPWIANRRASNSW